MVRRKGRSEGTSDPTTDARDDGASEYKYGVLILWYAREMVLGHGMDVGASAHVWIAIALLPLLLFSHGLVRT